MSRPRGEQCTAEHNRLNMPSVRVFLGLDGEKKSEPVRLTVKTDGFDETILERLTLVHVDDEDVKKGERRQRGRKEKRGKSRERKSGRGEGSKKRKTSETPKRANMKRDQSAKKEEKLLKEMEKNQRREDRLKRELERREKLGARLEKKLLIASKSKRAEKRA